MNGEIRFLSDDAPLDLIVVMPVYNEAECINSVVQSWCAMLDQLGIRYRIMALNDGSRDQTAAMLDSMAGATVEVVHKPNSGHGPTVLTGYRRAASQAEWVFQVDSDDELSPQDFPALWMQREGYAAVCGERLERQQPLARRLISMVSRATIRLAFGEAVRDVNVPYRLLRATDLREAVAGMPDDSFAPNVLLSGWLAWSRRPVLNLPVRHENRRTGTVSIVRWRLVRAACRSFTQTLAWRRTLQRIPRGEWKRTQS